MIVWHSEWQQLTLEVSWYRNLASAMQALIGNTADLGLLPLYCSLQCWYSMSSETASRWVLGSRPLRLS